MPYPNRTGRVPETTTLHQDRAPVACLAVLALLAACEVLAPAGPLPPDAQLMSAPPEYLEWWHKTEACSGRQGDPSAIEWYVVPDKAVFETSDGEKVGLWSRSSDGTRIVLAGLYAHNELVVRHEMLHALLNHEGHPSEYFVTRCQLTWDSWQGDE
jgi:hypothetical protein